MSDAVITAVLVSLIAGFFAITIFALVALIVVRRKNQESRDSLKVDDAIARMDNALDSALVELNKMGSLVKQEIDEKYQAMLFLYDLVDGKMKEMESYPTPPPPLPEVTSVTSDAIGQYLDDIKEETENPLDLLLGRSEPEPQRPTKFTSPKHEQVWNMFESGKDIGQIAKELGMGKGAVKLMLDFSGRTG